MNELQNKTGFLDFAREVSNRRDRMAIESIFSLACLYLVELNVLKASYDGAWVCSNGKWPFITDNFTKISMSR